MPGIGRDFRVISLPRSASDLPNRCVNLAPGESITEELEGGMETAQLVMEIANDHIAEGKIIMVIQDIDPSSKEIAFKCVAT